MKKIYKLTAIAGVLASATSFSSVYQLRSPVVIEGIGWTESISYSDWVASGDLYDCSYDIEEEDVYYGQEEIQTETCSQNQTGTKFTTLTNDMGYETTTTEEIEQVNEVTTEFEIVGTHIESSCKDALSFDSSLPSGELLINLNNGNEYTAYCDMSTDGGGWTRFDNSALYSSNFTKSETLYDGLSYAEEVNGQSMHVVGHDSGKSELSVDIVIDLDLSLSYSEFYFEDYEAHDHSESSGNSYDVNGYSLINTAWTTQKYPSMSNNSGDLAFGTSANSTPTVSYRSEGKKYSGYNISMPFTSTDIYDNGVNSSIFTFRTIDKGVQDEKLIYWYDGYIWVR